jgi:hypothetical protein
MISKTMGRLPDWLQWILGIAGAIVCIYGLAHYGWTFLLRVIFSPDL